MKTSRSNLFRSSGVRPDLEGGGSAALLLRCVDAQLAAVLFAVPLAMGGRVAIGRLVLVALVVGAALCWSVRQALVRRSYWFWSAAEPLLLAAIGLVGLQLVSLPPAVIKAISPHLYGLLPLWSPDTDVSARLGVWPCLSLAPVATRSGLMILWAYALLFLVGVQRFSRVEDIERLLRWVAVAGVAMAAFGVVQYLTQNGKYFWVYEYPLAGTSGAAKGSFTNRNHFAHFLILAIGPLVWWLQANMPTRNHRRSVSQNHPFSGRSHGEHMRSAERMPVGAGVAATALALCTFAVLLSFSRGGAAALLVATGVCLLILYRGSVLGGKTLLVFGGTGALLAACLAIHGYQQVSARLDDFQAVERLDASKQRRDLWRADLCGVSDFAMIGTGVGSHARVYPLYLPDNDVSQDLVYTHAENGPIQVALEAGSPGMLLLVVAMGLGFFWCRALLRSELPRRLLLCFAGIVPGLTASIAHSLVDFVWYIPGCMVVVVLLAAGLCRLSRIACQGGKRASPGWQTPRAAWAVAAVALLALACGTLPGMVCAVPAEQSWHHALKISRTLDGLEPASQRPVLETMAGELSEAVRWQPSDAPAHAKLAEVHLWLFQLAQADGPSSFEARQVREAALASASQLRSGAEVRAWVSKAFGAEYVHLALALEHARRAAALDPLDGSIYLHLAALTFLDGPGVPGKDACIQQALRVRPHDGSVLFEAGQEAMLSGQVEAAAALWRKSFQCGSRHQQRLMELLAGRLPPAFFVENFPLDLRAMRRLEAQYRRLNRPDEVRVLLPLHAQAAASVAGSREGSAARDAWLEAASAYQELDEAAASVECLRRAVRCDSCDFNARYALAMRLFRGELFEEAEEHLIWCHQRKPYDRSLNSAMEALVNRRVGRERTSLTRHEQVSNAR